MTVKICDGGFSAQVKNYTAENLDGDPLWISKLLKLHPDKCISVHKDFIIAGANIISTATYQASIEGFKQYLGLGENETKDLMKNSVKLVREGIRLAKEETGIEYNVQVAGSVGPYGAFLHDGSEYTGIYCDKYSEEALIEWHRPRIEALIEGGVDFLALETLPCTKEALALLRLLKEYPSTKAWISFSIKDSQSISNGENFCEAAERCWRESDQLVGIGGNCFDPMLVTALLKPLRERHPYIPTIVYPNSGEKYDTAKGCWLSKEINVNIEDFVEEWLNLGVHYLGGCCRTDSTDISRMKNIAMKWEKNTLNS